MSNRENAILSRRLRSHGYNGEQISRILAVIALGGDDKDAEFAITALDLIGEAHLANEIYIQRK